MTREKKRELSNQNIYFISISSNFIKISSKFIDFSSVFFCIHSPYRLHLLSNLTPPDCLSSLAIQASSSSEKLQITPSTMSSANMFYRVKQLRSTIGLGPNIRKNMEALGLRKRDQVVYQAVSVATAHKLRLVKELVSIDLLPAHEIEERSKTDKQKWPRGFEKIGLY